MTNDIYTVAILVHTPTPRVIVDQVPADEVNDYDGALQYICSRHELDADEVEWIATLGALQIDAHFINRNV